MTERYLHFVLPLSITGPQGGVTFLALGFNRQKRESKFNAPKRTQIIEKLLREMLPRIGLPFQRYMVMAIRCATHPLDGTDNAPASMKSIMDALQNGKWVTNDDINSCVKSIVVQHKVKHKEEEGIHVWVFEHTAKLKDALGPIQDFTDARTSTSCTSINRIRAFLGIAPGVGNDSGRNEAAPAEMGGGDHVRATGEGIPGGGYLLEDSAGPLKELSRKFDGLKKAIKEHMVNQAVEPGDWEENGGSVLPRDTAIPSEGLA